MHRRYHLRILFLVFASGSIAAGQSAGTFTATGSMTTPRWGHSATLLPNGKVLIAGVLPGYGKLVLIDHGDGFVTAYGYNEQVYVKEGDRVRVGQRIASVGRPSQGSRSRLFFQVRRNQIPVDPLKYLN